MPPPGIAQNFGGENFGEFGKTNVIHQYFTQPNSRFTKVANVSYRKFVNILPKFWNDRFAKVLPHQNFALYDNLCTKMGTSSKVCNLDHTMKVLYWLKTVVCTTLLIREYVQIFCSIGWRGLNVKSTLKKLATE